MVINIIVLCMCFSTSLFGIPDQKPFKLGLENVTDSIWQKLLSSSGKKQSIGLITNQTGKSQKGTRSIDLLLSHGLNVSRIFVPEHGLDGTIGAEHEVHNSIDKKTKIPIISLYGNGTGKKIGALFKGLDIIIFDMQDSGMRHYTYISTLLHSMEAAAQQDKMIVVFDRPNPLGIIMEGPVSPKNAKSFIAAAPIPLRHGMTIGELALYFNAHVLKKKAHVHVVKMENFKRAASLTHLPFTALSPNIKSLPACYGYSFLGLLGEVKPFDIGLGTIHAMECLALPQSIPFSQSRWNLLKTELAKNGIGSQLISYFSPRKKQQCTGLKLQIKDINKAYSFCALLAILKLCHDAKVPLTFSKEFDVAIGTKKVHDYIIGHISYAELANDINKQLTLFYTNANSSFLYKPGPMIHAN